MGDGAREITKAGIEVRLNLNVYLIFYIHSRLLDLFPIFWGFVLIWVYSHYYSRESDLHSLHSKLCGKF